MGRKDLEKRRTIYESEPPKALGPVGIGLFVLGGLGIVFVVIVLLIR